MARVYGNRAPYYYGGVQGTGQENGVMTGCWLSVTGKIGEVVYLSVNDLSNNIMQMGCYVQATGSIKLDFTLQNPTVATNRENQDASYWANTQTITSNVIAITDVTLFTAVRITFTTASEVFFYTR